MRPVRTLLTSLALVAAVTTAHAGDRFGGESPLHHRSRGSHVRVVTDVHFHSQRTCTYEPGHHETRVRRVVVPGHHIERVVPDRYVVRWDDSCGRYVRVLVHAGAVVREWVPARVEEHRDRVWVPGRWICRGC